MQTFLVGGAVRDQLLGLPVKERDWVVVGETPESLLNKGFKPVGKEFPVYLHPRTHEEYALARTEKKTAPGYRGFSVEATPEVTLEQDLSRRDLTINAIARDHQGRLIDPFHGQQDLKRKVLRHISEAFCEDPVRILRVARFAARYAHLGFAVAEETQCLMQSMVASGEVDALVAERVWSEFVRALGEPSPGVFVEVLRECGALERLFPEIDRLFAITAAGAESTGRNRGELSLKGLRQVVRMSRSPEVRFAVLTYDVGKDTAQDRSPAVGGDPAGATTNQLDRLCDRLKAPQSYRSLSHQVIHNYPSCRDIFSLSAHQILSLLQGLRALRKSTDLRPFATACGALNRVRGSQDNKQFPQADFLLQCQTIALNADASAIVKRGVKGPRVGEELGRARVSALRRFLAQRTDGERRATSKEKPKQ